jgi:DME family drug/metabolite transporter
LSHSANLQISDISFYLPTRYNLPIDKKGGIILVKLSGYAFILFAATLWGTSGTTQALAPIGATPQTLGVFRLLGGALTLSSLAYQHGTLSQARSLPIKLTLFACILMSAYQLLFFAGVGMAGVAVGTVVGIGSAPIIAGLLKIFVERQPITHRWLLSTALAITGCTLLLFPSQGIQINLLGVILAIGAGASYAIYTLCSKILFEGRDSDAVTGVIFFGSTMLLLPTLWKMDNISWIFQPSGVILFIWLGLIATGLSYWSFGRGLKLVPASTAVTLTLAEPLTAGLLGVFVLGERLTPLGVIGILMLILGLSILRD